MRKNVPQIVCDRCLKKIGESQGSYRVKVVFEATEDPEQSNGEKILDDVCERCFEVILNSLTKTNRPRKKTDNASSAKQKPPKKRGKRNGRGKNRATQGGSISDEQRELLAKPPAKPTVPDLI